MLSGIPHTDKLLLIGYFNARIGREHDKWPLVMGKHGIGKCNSNGELLLALCFEFELIVMNTIRYIRLFLVTSALCVYSSLHLLYAFINCYICSMLSVLATYALCALFLVKSALCVCSLIHLPYAFIPYYICSMRLFIVTSAL